MKVMTLIPARYGSERLPGKPLAEINGKPMIQWVFERASKACFQGRPIPTSVVTDDPRIATAIEKIGGKVLISDRPYPSGSARVAGAIEQLKKNGGDFPEIVVNVQGDEPLIESEVIEGALNCVIEGGFEVGTAMTPFESAEQVLDLNAVKVLADVHKRAVYFSRYPIPYSRTKPVAPFQCQRHLGIYVYRVKTLEHWMKLPASGWEAAESLEQLRALANGISIGVTEVKSQSFGVDTPADLERARKILNKGSE